MRKVPFIERLSRKRTEKIVNLLDDFVNTGEKVLDIGAGAGWIAKEIQKRKEAEVLLLDIADYNQTDLQLVLYDGQNMPFQGNSFDISLLIFTLHHCKAPLKVLREVKRVTRKKNIIVEDVPSGFLGKILLCFWDTISNLPGLIRPPGESMYFNFKSIAQWEESFENLNLELISKRNFSSFKIISHTLFALKVLN